jgi:ketosteroid isomerase-like protein
MSYLRTMVCLSLIAPCLASAAAMQDPSDVSVRATLVQLERNWNDAFYRKDVDTIDRILADEFIATYDDGTRGDRDKELSNIIEFDQQVISAVQDGFIVKVYGDTAVVWFRLNLVGMRGGAPSPAAFNFTDVFVWRDDRWQCVSSQSTRIESV